VRASGAPARVRRRPLLEVDARGALGLVGTLIKFLALAPLFPAALALGYGETPWPFLGTTAIVGAVGLLLERVGRESRAAVGSREGYLVVALTWLLAGMVGGLPYVLAGQEHLDRPVDALFEGMSGFTTTGATLLVDIESLDHSLAMWRQFTQWLGGLGIIVLVLAVLPRLRVGGRQMLESEMPGPEVDQLGERIRSTVRRIWVLYLGLTVAEALVLASLGWTGIDDAMSPFEAVAHALTTIPTGGFSTESRSIEAFGPATQWVLVVFMVLAGLNFALLWRAVIGRRPMALLRDEESRVYVTLLALASSVLVVELATETMAGSDAALRNGVFQAVSLMTGTGYASTDFAGWTTLALMLLVLLMFVGGAAGSTTGSVKVLRHLLLGKVLRRELRQTLHAELVSPVRLNGRVVDEQTLRAVGSFVLLYLALFVVGTGVIVVDSALQGPDLTPLDAISAAAATLGNVGPATGPIGPMLSYEPFSDVSTVTMSLLMLLGRIEVIPVIVLLTRRYWRV
jgi:trk/ktr system potassium uptake protein